MATRREDSRRRTEDFTLLCTKAHVRELFIENLMEDVQGVKNSVTHDERGEGNVSPCSEKGQFRRFDIFESRDYSIIQDGLTPELFEYINNSMHGRWMVPRCSVSGVWYSLCRKITSFSPK